MSTIKKISAIGLSLTTVVWLSGAIMLMPTTVIAATADDLQAQITALLAQITALQAQLGSTATATNVPVIAKDLKLGSKGDDVKSLQVFLNAQGYQVSASGAGSPGNETTYFGSKTKAALAKYQAAVGISPAVGYFGPKTRAYLASLAVAPTTPTTPITPTTPTTPVITPPSGEALAIALASDTPGAKTLGSGTAFNPALKVNLTAGSKAVKVTGITLKKSGFLANTNLNGVDIVDSKGVRHGNVITSINADNTILITMTTDPLTVAAGATETITVRFNLLSGNYNGTVSFDINAATAFTSDATSVTGTFPISGVAMNIVNGGSSLASTTLDVLTSTGSSSLNVAAADLQEMTRFRIQEVSSNEAVNLHSLTLYNYGNAGATDYSDVTLLAQDDTVLATAQPVGQYITFNLATPYLIDKGLTKDFTVKAKLIGGTTKTIQLVVYNNYDIDLRGAATNVSVIPGAGSNDSSFPIGNGFNIQTIGSGSITLSRTSDSPSSAVTPGSTNVILAKYKVKPVGENYELRQVSFYIATSSAGIVLTGTVFVKIDNSTVFSTAASGVGVAAATTFTLSSYTTLTAGQDAIITIEASINSSATSASSYQVQDFDLIQAKRLVTNDLVDPGTSVVDGLTISVNSGALAVTTLSTPVANSVVAGATNYEYATIQLNAQSSGENVKVSKIVVTHTGSVAGEVGNLLMYKDSETSPLATTASTATNAATVTFNFSSQIVVAKATPVTLHLKADVLSGTNAHTFKVASSTSALTAVGAVTGNSLTNGSDITFAGNGQAQTHVAAGTVTLSLISGTGGSPSLNQVVNAGTTGGSYFAFKMASQYEGIKITSLKITATSTGGGNLATTTLVNIKLYEGSASTPFASAPQFDTCDASKCTVTFTASDNLLANPVPTAGVTIYAKADIAGANAVLLGNNFKFMIASSTGDVAAKGAVSGSTSITRTGTPTASGVTYVIPQGVVISAVSPTAPVQIGTSDGQTIGVFKIANNGTAPIYIGTSTTGFSFSNAGSASTSLTFGLYTAAQGSTASDVTYIATSTAYGTSTTIPFNTAAVSEANRKIDGGSWRYFTVKTNGAAANNNTFKLSVSAIGNVLFDVYESDLGYDANGDGDQSDYITGLYVDGTPSLESVTAKT